MSTERQPASHADRDGSECQSMAQHFGIPQDRWDRGIEDIRARMEREHERALAAYVPEDEPGEVETLRSWLADARAALRNMDRLLTEAGDREVALEAELANLRAALARVEATRHAWATGPWMGNPVVRDLLDAIRVAMADPEAAS